MSDKHTRAPLTTAVREMLQRYDTAQDRDPNELLTLFEWRGDIYLGRLLRPYPEKPYISYIVRETDLLAVRMAAALRRQGSLPTVRVHPRLEFTGRRYLLGLTGEMLCALSGEDILYCMIHRRHPQGEPVQTGAETTGYDSP